MSPISFRVLLAVLTALVATGSTTLASPENDRVYQLESIAWLKASDNVDGIFSEYLDEAYAKYFLKQSRFVIKKIKSVDEILDKSKTPYSELVQQPDILKKIAQKFKVECLIRTRVYKEAATYRFMIDWVYAPRGDVLASYEFRFTDPGKDKGLEGSELPQAIENALDELIKKLPFLGQVTGVQSDTITVNLGRNQRVSPGDILTIYTLQSVKRHPVLHTIEEWRWQPVGRARAEQVEESITFAKVIDTEPNVNVIRLQKIREIITPPPTAKTDDANKRNDDDVPRIGWIAANLGAGSYSREVGTGSSGRTGSGFGAQFDLEGQVWLTSRWLSQIGFGGGLTKYSPKNLQTGAEIGSNYSGSSTQFRIVVGYALYPAKTVFDPIGWVHFGYRTTNYTLPTSSSDFVSSSNFGSLVLGVGGEVPIRKNWGLQIGIDLGLLRSASQTDTSFGDATGSSDLMFAIGGTYRLEERILLRLLVKVNSQSMDFTGGESVSQKTLSIGPSVMYYF